MRCVPHCSSRECDEHARALRLVTTNVWAIINQGQARVLRQALEQFTERQLDQLDWVAALLARGQVYTLLGENPAARASFEAAYSQAQASPAVETGHQLRPVRAWAWVSCCNAARPKKPWTVCSVGWQRVTGTQSLEEAALRIRIGRSLIYQGKHAEAIAALEQGLALLPPGPSRLHIVALGNLGTCHSIQGDVERGITYYRQGLEIAWQMDDYWMMIEGWHNLGIELDAAGRWAEALAQLQQALEQAERLGGLRQQAREWLGLGVTLLKQGDHESATSSLGKCIAIARSQICRT